MEKWPEMVVKWPIVIVIRFDSDYYSNKGPSILPESWGSIAVSPAIDTPVYVNSMYLSTSEFSELVYKLSEFSSFKKFCQVICSVSLDVWTKVF